MISVFNVELLVNGVHYSHFAHTVRCYVFYYDVHHVILYLVVYLHFGEQGEALRGECIGHGISRTAEGATCWPVLSSCLDCSGSRDLVCILRFICCLRISSKTSALVWAIKRITQVSYPLSSPFPYSTLGVSWESLHGNMSIAQTDSDVREGGFVV